MKKINLIITALLLSTASLSAVSAPFTQEQEQRIRELIRETLVTQPQILDEAIGELQKQEMAKQDSVLKNLLKDNAAKLYNNADSPKIGPKNAALTLVYFTDYNCPYCKQFEASLEKVMAKHADVNLIIKPLPYLGDSSQSSAELALTLWQTQPEKFAAFHQGLISKNGRHDQASIQKVLSQINMPKLTATAQAKASLENNTRLAETLGVGGTPVTVVGDTMLMGLVPYEDLEAAVVAALKQSKS